MSRVCLLETEKQFRSLKNLKYSKVYVGSGHSDKAETLPQDLLDVTKVFVAQSKAAEQIDWVYNELCAGGMDELFTKIFDDKRAKVYVKKEIVLSLAKIFVSFALAAEFKQKYMMDENIDFIPQPFEFTLYELLKSRNVLPAGIHVPHRYLDKLKRLERTNGMICDIGTEWYPRFIKCVMRGKNEYTQKRNYKYGILMWNSGINMIKPGNKLEFLHPESFDTNELMYIMDRKMQAKVVERVASNEFDQCYFHAMVKAFNPRIYTERIYPEIKSLVKEFKSFVCTHIVKQAFLKAMKYKIEWGIFFEQYEVKRFIAMQDPGLSARTLILEGLGAEVDYVYKSTSFDYAPRENMNIPADLYYSYMIYGTMYSNKISNETFAVSHNEINNYVNVGTFVADTIMNVKNDQKLKKDIKSKLGLSEGSIIIGFYDTAIGRKGYWNLAEGVESYKQIIQLLEDNNDYTVVFRSRNTRLIGKDQTFTEMFNKLKGHSRVIYANDKVPEYVGTDYMGVCDIVIGGFGSSVPMEAWAGGIKAVCQMGSERFMHPSYVILRMPNFAVLGYEDLKQAVGYWLSQSAEDIEVYQNQYVKKYIDQYCDGKAKHRLHQYLYNL